MRVILLQDVKNVGKKDDVVEVSEGYGINFLIKKGLAVMFTAHSKAILNKQKEDRAKQEADNKKKAEELSKVLENITLEFTAKCGKDGYMIGTITKKQVCEELMKKHNLKIDKRTILGDGKVNTFGYARLKVELHKGVFGIINVHVSEQK